MNILASLAPIALYLVVLKAMDAFSFARWRKLIGCFLWGVVSVFIILSLSLIWQKTHNGITWQGIWISPLVEETIKVLPLLYFISRKQIVFLAETLIYGQMVGGGFATAENILYLSANSHMAIGTAIVRGFSTSMLHMGCTAVIATLALYPLLRLANKEKFHRVLYIIGTLLAFVPSIGLHTIYNMQLLPPMIQLLMTVVCFLLLFIWLSYINERLVVKWLDLSLNSDIQLIASLRDGEFVDSPAGQYLVSIRERFEPLVFFDLCTYLILHIKLLVAAKSQVMLHEAGLDTPLSEEEQKSYREQYAELEALSHRIPRLGFILIRPILNTTNQDRWAIRRLCK